MTFKEQMESAKNQLKGLITTDTPQTQIDTISGIIETLDEADKSHQSVVADYGKMKDLYIKSITNSGTAEKPQELGEKAPRSIEQIAADLKAQQAKK